MLKPMSKEIKEDKERIKDLIEDGLLDAKSKRLIRIGTARLDDFIKSLCFNIDNPDYVRKT
tara:strand:+ start:306 stop:488 length:183 start_codon:yes stop_codon:yes gene_type:complete